jgi:tetratricopeptide (TPR) repeat protein
VESLADLVRELDLLRARAARGSRKARVSLDELAARVGMPRSTVHAHITGVTMPPIDVLDQIVIALDAAPDEQASWSEAWYRVAARPRSPAGPPPLSTPRQLPPDVSGFTGRADSLAALDQLLAGPGPVVAAISGTAGVGKTSLAVRWAHRVADRFPDGQLYLNLRGYDPTAPVSPAAALGIALRDLGVPSGAIRPTLGEQVSQYRTLLADRRVLVVLDNANSPEQVRDLLPGSPACFVVVTSRDALTGLVARDGARRIDLGLLPVADALTLLRSLIGERVDDDTVAAHALAERCARLPLALRIAAERSHSRPGMPLAVLVDDLSDERRRLDVLDAGGDDKTAVRAVFSWSYRNLSPAAARFFRLLGCQPGRHFDVHAAAAVTGADLADAARSLSELVRTHLVEPFDADRYRMHDLLRAYAAELAAAEPEQDRHTALTGTLDYYRRAAAAAMDLVYPSERARRPVVPDVAAALPPMTCAQDGRGWLDVEIDNLVAAVGFAAEHGFAEHVADLASTLWRHLDTTARWTEAISVHTCALASARAAADLAAEANSLRHLGIVSEHQGRYEDAIEYFELSLKIRSELGDNAGMAAVLTALGITLEAMSRFEQAVASHRRALDLRREVGDRHGEATTLLNLGIAHESLGDHELAADQHRQALRRYLEMGDRLGAAHALNNLGNALRRLDECADALDHHERALVLYRDLGSREGEAFALAGLGADLHRLDRFEDAVERHEQALVIVGEIGLPGLHSEVLNNLGETLLDAGRVEEARAAHESALAVTAQHDDRLELARASHGIGRALQAAGLSTEAGAHLRAALALYDRLGVPVPH